MERQHPLEKALPAAVPTAEVDRQLTLRGDPELFQQLLCTRWTERGRLNMTAEDGPGRRLCTHRDARVLVQDDLEQMWGENGRCFKPFLRF